LVIKKTSAGRMNAQLLVAWRGNQKGKALAWWIKQLGEKGWLQRAMAPGSR
jgi:hypothetical protein